MKKVITIGIILFLILSGITKADNNYNDYYLLLDMVENMEGKTEEGNISFNGIIKDKFMNQEEITKLGESIRKDLNIDGNEIDPLIATTKLPENYYTKEVIFDEGFSQITYTKKDNEENFISIILSSNLNQNEVDGKTYLYINIIKKSDFLKINDIIDKIDRVFKASNQTMEITSYVRSTIPGKIREKDINSKVKKILEEMDAKVIEEDKDEFYISYIMYSPLIENYLTINKKMINLNLAIRYNEYEDKTYILIGTPVITIGY